MTDYGIFLANTTYVEMPNFIQKSILDKKIL